MKAAVVTFPGSNCDDDALYALRELAGFDVTSVWHKDSPDLGEMGLVVLPGGFSYGDYLRCGAMASVSPVMAKVCEYASRGGLVLGICNGFQILCEVGLVPGALARNEGLGFVCKDVELKVTSSDSPWTCDIKVGEKLTFPIAHGEGRYVVEEEEYLRMESSGQILLRYQENPNGSMHSVAGVTNTAKNVFGLMPHPERATDLRSKDGVKLWSSIQKFLKGKP